MAEEAGTGDTRDNGKLFYFPNLSSIKAASSEVAAGLGWAGGNDKADSQLH